MLHMTLRIIHGEQHTNQHLVSSQATAGYRLGPVQRNNIH